MTVGAPAGPVDVPDHRGAAALADDLDLEALGAQQLGDGRRRWPRRGAWSNASSDTLGMRVRVSRSARMSGIRACTRCCRAASRSGARASSVTPASVPTAPAGPTCAGRSTVADPRPVRRDRAMPTIGAPRHTVWIVLGRKKAAEPAVTVQDRVERRGGQEPAHPQPPRAGGGAQASPRADRPQGRARSPTDKANRARPGSSSARP